MKKIRFFLFIIKIIFIHLLNAQLTDINYYDIDTISNKKQNLFSKSKTADIEEMVFLEFLQKKADTMTIFKNYWSNKNIYPYSYPTKAVMPDTVKIILQDSLHKFVMPSNNNIISGFGWRRQRMHNGIDIKLIKGQPIKSAFDGKVRYAKYHNNGYGNLVIIRHFNGIETYYSHLDEIYVKENQIVRAGQIIGTGGNTGASWTSAHLHFEMRYLDNPFDPLLAINFDSLKLHSDTLILTVNNFKTSNLQKITTNIDTSTSEVSSSKTTKNYHTIQKGDTLTHIAKKYGTTIERLCQLNNIKPNDILRIGQKIKIR